MVKKTITYNTFDGREVTGDFYFNLTRTECNKKNLTTPGGYVELMDRIVKTQDAPALYTQFEEFVLDSYGEKSPDGFRFIKSKELSEAFSQTDAYDRLMQELMTDAEKAGDFFKAVLPKPESVPAVK